MPSRPPGPCCWKGHPPCPDRAVVGGYLCEEHRAVTRATSDARRRAPGSGQAYGRSHRERFRAGVLARDNQCMCVDDCPPHLGLCMEAATVADHHPLGRGELRARGLDIDDPRYGRGLCKGCHDRRQGRDPGRHGYR